MRTDMNSRGSVPFVSLLVATLLSLYGAANGSESFAKQCAALDLQLVSTIEEHGEAGTWPSDRLSASYFKLLDARSKCRSGRVAEAVRMYGEISPTSVEAAVKR
jgi:hypothetical protein